jgi:hypothetical protein
MIGAGKIGREKKCANARMCTREAREGARGPEEAVPVLKQVLAPRRRAWQPRRSLGRSSATWRLHGVGRAAARQKSDAWDVGRQEVAREMLRRRAAAKCSSGRRRAAWRGEGKPARSR